MSTQTIPFARPQSASPLALLRTKLGELRLHHQQAKARRQGIARVEHELSVCTDRQLADLGFSRSDIPDIARGRFARA